MDLNPEVSWSVASVFGVGIVVLIGLQIALLFRRLSPTNVSTNVLITALLVHVGLGALRFSLFGLWAPDAITYHEQAVQTAQGTQVAFAVGKEGWPLLAGRVYSLIGPEPAVMTALSSLLVVMAAWFVAESTIALRRPKAARSAFLLACYLPPFLIWGDTMLREAACWASVSLALLSWVRIRAGQAGWLLLILATGLVFEVRGSLAVVLIFSLVLSHVFALTRGRGFAQILVLPLFGLIVIFGPTALTAAAGQYGYDVAQLNASRTALAREGSTSFGTVDTTSSSTDVLVTGVSILPRATLGPFPWEWRPTSGYILTASDALVWWWALSRLWRGRTRIPKLALTYLVIPALSILMTLAASSGNYGTLVRLRAIALIAILPLVAISLARDQPVAVVPDPITDTEAHTADFQKRSFRQEQRRGVRRTARGSSPTLAPTRS